MIVARKAGTTPSVRRTVVINVVGLTPALLKQMPTLRAWAEAGRTASIRHMTPAVTCSVQATYLTGKLPSEHGIVGNGWYDREDCEIKFWKQSDKLVQRPRIWDLARQRNPGFTCANLFWWYAMYSSADVTVTPRPMYPADGRKIPDVWTHPPALRDELQDKLGRFPLFSFWGPKAGIESSQWIADAAVGIMPQHSLTLIYLPHLDYALQKFGPGANQSAESLAEIDKLLDGLITHAEQAGCRIVLLSEYGIEAVDRPIHLNRLFRTQKLISIREERGTELLDPGASKAFAVADHQVAHIYVNDSHKIDEVEQMVKSTPGVDRVLRGAERAWAGLDHRRSGDLVAIAAPGAWFTYYHWLQDDRAPDFARTVDIHRKPGYDPVELFLDPAKPLVAARVAWKLFKRKLGFRTLLDVIPLDATLVRGSHGREPSSAQDAPLFITSQPNLLDSDRIEATSVCDLLLRHVFD